MIPSNACAKGLQGFTKTLVYRLQYKPILKLSQSPSEMFCDVKERNFSPTTKRNNAHNYASLHANRLHLYTFSFLHISELGICFLYE